MSLLISTGRWNVHDQSEPPAMNLSCARRLLTFIDGARPKRQVFLLCSKCGTRSLPVAVYVSSTAAPPPPFDSTDIAMTCSIVSRGRYRSRKLGAATCRGSRKKKRQREIIARPIVVYRLNKNANLEVVSTACSPLASIKLDELFKACIAIFFFLTNKLFPLSPLTGA